jgi:hypothetical protein
MESADGNSIYFAFPRDGIGIAIPDRRRRLTPPVLGATGGDCLRPEKYKRIGKEGVLHATIIKDIRFFPQAPRFTNRVRAPVEFRQEHVSGEKR